MVFHENCRSSLYHITTSWVAKHHNRLFIPDSLKSNTFYILEPHGYPPSYRISHFVSIFRELLVTYKRKPSDDGSVPGRPHGSGRRMAAKTVRFPEPAPPLEIRA